MVRLFELLTTASNSNISLLIKQVLWAVNSAGECHLHTVEVTGSIPVPPTRAAKNKGADFRVPFFVMIQLF